MIRYPGSRMPRVGAGAEEGVEEAHLAVTPVYLHLIFGEWGRLFTFPGSEFGG